MNVGSLIGQYRIIRKLGAGGMGAVYLGEHILLGRRAAIKTLLSALSSNTEIVERFFTEARATSAINDPGVVQIFDFGYHVDGAAYIVMELLEGEALSERIDRLGQLPISEGLRIARQAASSLAAAHERGIVHRDLKPENIFLIHDAEAQGGERTKILDFGICKVGKLGMEDSRVTQSGAMLGTPVYMSPEQCRGVSDEVDHRSDIYALGCVLFHMLTGRAPFEHDAPGDFIVSHLREEAPAPSTFVPALPPMVDEVLERCLAKSPDDRFQSMGELQSAIEYVLGHISAPGTSTELARPAMLLGRGFKSVYDANLGATRDIRPMAKTPPPAGTSQIRPRPARRVLLGLVVIAVVAAAGVLATRVTIGGVEAVAEPSYRYTTPVEQLVTPPPAPVEPVEIAPAPPRSELIESAPAPREVERAPAKRVEKRAASQPKPKPRRKTKARTTPKPPPASAPTIEDLYDTR